MARNKIKATKKNTALASHIMRQPTEVSNQTVLEKLVTKNNLLKAEIKKQELMERNKTRHEPKAIIPNRFELLDNEATMESPLVSKETEEMECQESDFLTQLKRKNNQDINNNQRIKKHSSRNTSTTKHQATFDQAKDQHEERIGHPY